ncbi:hypothetical protein NKDENANG_01421 [Candidatus Entotheonellaceae bacterium PAL068K]
MALIAGFIGAPGALLIGLGSLGLVGVCAVMLRCQPALYTVTMTLGALLWLIGNDLWLAGGSIPHVVPWWAGFVVLTIAGERLELSCWLQLFRRSQTPFVLAVGLILMGFVLSMSRFDRGVRLDGVGLFTLAVWLLRHDLARRTIRRPGLTRFIAVSLPCWFGRSRRRPVYDRSGVS